VLNEHAKIGPLSCAIFSMLDGLDASPDNDVEQLWLAESKRRYQAYLNGEIEALPGEEVMTRARNRLTDVSTGFTGLAR